MTGMPRGDPVHPASFERLQHGGPVAPDIQLILVVTKQDAEVWAAPRRVPAGPPGRSAAGRQQECFPWPDGSDFQTRYCWHPGPPPAGRSSLEHQIGDAHGVFVVKIQEFPGFHHTEIRLYHSCGLDGDGDPADPGFIGGLSLEETVPFHVDTVAEGVAGMGEAGETSNRIRGSHIFHWPF